MTPPTPKSQNEASKVTRVAAGSKIVGEITGSTALVVDGVVEGRVQLNSNLTVGTGGLVKGEVEARGVRIGGKVKGNIRGKEMIEILANGSVEGDVQSPRVVISDGAFFKGKVEMVDEGKASPPAPKRPSTSPEQSR
jgi:cytoskeletal protein CcmA (bactofilin family)